MRPWEKNIRQVVPYVPGEQPAGDKIVKLNTNENPYPPAPGVKKVLEEMEADRLRKYPDPTASILVKELASYYGLNEDQVFVGVGSDDVLAMSFLTFFNSDKPVLFPDVTYSFYKVWADLFKVPFETPVLKEDFTIDVKDYEKENGGVIFPNPNAPTGVYMPLDQVEEILKANQDVVVIVDEAYVDFAGPSALELLDKYENLLVVQTFSKSRSMAGMRIGFAMGHPDLIRALNDVKYSYNSYTMNLPSLLAGVEAVKDKEYFEKNRVIYENLFNNQDIGSVLLNDDGRKTFFEAWQKRKQDVIMHPFLQEKIPWGLVPFVQAQLLARYIRGDIDEYPSYLWK